MTPYLAFIHPPESGSAWGVTFPDLPGCISAGESFEAAIRNAHEALSSHLAALLADGDPIPGPRSFADVAADPSLDDERRDAVVQLVQPRSVPAERVRVNITIDKGILRLADEAAEARGLTRSGFIEQAIEVDLDRSEHGQLRVGGASRRRA
jgi:predicted RNase H-like HicB family nuclease